MSTPITNSVGSTVSVVSSALGNVASLVSGYRWTSKILDYSFPGSDGASAYSSGSSYGNYGGNEWDEWYALNRAQQDAVIAVMGALEGIGGLRFGDGPVPDNDTQVGLLRFAGSAAVTLNSENAYAYSSYPFSTPAAGDVWFSADWMRADVSAGTYAFASIIHEVLHGLGLKHPFEATDYSDTLMPEQYDSQMYTVMSYTTLAGDEDSGAFFYPTTPMYYDIAAIEAIYGPSNKNLGSTTYTYDPSGQYWETIVDSGGVDTLVYDSIAGDVTLICLKRGAYCEFGQPIEYYNVPAGQEFDSRTVWIGPSTTIERAFGGAGKDTIIGNNVSNQLFGQDGADKLTGNGGADKLDGGGGNDTLKGNSGSDKLYGGAGNDWLSGGPGTEQLTGGADADRFVFDAPKGNANADTILDFQHLTDIILLDQTIYKALGVGALEGNAFKAATDIGSSGGGTGVDADDRVLYDSDSGKLYYDSNGSGSGSRALIATLWTESGSHPTLSAEDFLIIA